VLHAEIFTIEERVSACVETKEQATDISIGHATDQMTNSSLKAKSFVYYRHRLFLNVYCNLQSTHLDRVISKVEVRKGREAGTIHRWFTGVVLLS